MRDGVGADTSSTFHMMRYGNIPQLEKPLSRLAQGVVTASAETAEQDFRMFDAVLEMGGTVFDTAHVYGQGESERTLGKWIHERGVRERVVIITKGAHPNKDGIPRVTPQDITQDLFESLERLCVETIDLYLLHRDDPRVPVDEIVDVLNEHQRAGRIRVFGGSNWSHTRIQQANAYAAARGLAPFGITSPNFSLAVQVEPPWDGCHSIGGEQGRAAREWYAATQLPIFAWSSLAGGFFSGRFRRDNLETFTDYFDALCVKSYCVEENFARLDRAQALAQAKQVSLAQIALAYVLHQPLNIFALVGCRTPDEFRANVEACSVMLSAVELDWLETG